MQGNVKPLGDRVLIERLDGDGREEISKGGIILPAHDARLRQGNAKRVPDTFRARVLAVSTKARWLSQGELTKGVEVLVHTYDNNDSDRTLAGDETRYGMLVGVDDIIGVVETFEESLGNHEIPASHLFDSFDAAHLIALETAPLMGMVPKVRDHQPPQAIASLGFHRKSGF